METLNAHLNNLYDVNPAMFLVVLLVVIPSAIVYAMNKFGGKK